MTKMIEEKKIPKKNWIDVEMNDSDQKLAALYSGADAFALVGGVSLMLTESVENGSDAIEEYVAKFGKIDQGTITIEVDKSQKRVIIRDDGTGILFPIHVLKKPFRSLKRNVVYAKGQFGRGLQGFRKFCENLTYVSKRIEIIDEEEKRLDKENFSGKTVVLGLKNSEARGSIEIVDDSIFSKYSDASTGTVALYENWLPGEFENLDVEKLKTRIQHHFGELIRNKKIKVIFKIGNKQEEMQPRIYNEDHRIPISPVRVNGLNGNNSEIKFHLYYTSRTETSEYKKPFLMVQGRPLGDSFISSFPEFLDQDVWKSQYVTGFIQCDFVKPNALRIAPEPGKEKELMVKHIRESAAYVELKVREFQSKLFDKQMKEEMDDLVVEMQKFLRDKNVFKFPPVINKGLLTDTSDEGWLDIEKGGNDLPTLEPSGEDEIIKTGESDGDGESGKEGKQKEVKINPELEGHLPRRKRLRRPSGFGLDFEPNELSDDLSWFDEISKTVIINQAHPRYKHLWQKSVERGEDSSYHKQLRKYISENYLWQISYHLGTKAELPYDELSRKFFNLKFEFFEDRPSW